MALPSDAERAEGRTRLLYVVGELDKGGQERQLFYLVRSLERDGYRCAVAVWNYGEDDLHCRLVRRLGVRVYAVRGNSRMAKLRAFRQLVRSLQPEVVHSYSFHTNFAAWWATVGTRTAPIGSIRSNFLWARDGSGAVLGRLSARWPAFHISNSAAAAASATRSRSYFAPRQCAVVVNGTDLETYRSSSPPPSSRPQVAAIGYLLPIKRWDRLIDAAAALRAQGLDFEVAIVGDGPLRAELEAQAFRLGLGDCVTFRGHVDDVAAVLNGSSFAVLTSDSEGCPNVIMEAMASGRAVVATDVGDIACLVQHGTTGFVVPLNDQEALVRSLGALVRDPALARRMGVAGRVWAEGHFGLERFARQTLEAYKTAGWRGGASDVCLEGDLAACR